MLTTTETSGADATTARRPLVESRMRWAVEMLAEPGPGLAEDPRDHFVAAFVDKHGDGLSALLDSWRAQGPFTVESYTPVAHKGWATLIGPTGDRFTLSIVIDSSGLIRGLGLGPELVIPPLRDWDELDAALDVPGVTSTALVARLVDDRWVSLYERSPDRLMPTGSAYKLYLLRALARAIEAGTVRWDEELTLLPQLRSLPTGEMQDLPDGARATVREVAHKMIAMSDNTAADMVLHRLGRDAVHRAVVDSGHQDPDVLRPFLSSRELFEIGWGDDPSLLPEWSAGDRARRYELLRRIERPLTTRMRDLNRPVYHLGLDWFLSARDVANALAGVWRDTTRDRTGTIREIVTTYPGVPIDGERWPVAVFKGGSSPGVVMFCWLLVDPAGVPHVVVLQQCGEDPGQVGDGLRLRGLGDRIIHSLLP